MVQGVDACAIREDAHPKRFGTFATLCGTAPHQVGSTANRSGGALDLEVALVLGIAAFLDRRRLVLAPALRLSSGD